MDGTEVGQLLRGQVFNDYATNTLLNGDHVWVSMNQLVMLANLVLAAAPAQAEPSDKSKLHAAIMNISTDDAASVYQFNDAHAHYCYKVGHRDARHAAAELVIANR